MVILKRTRVVLVGLIFLCVAAILSTNLFYHNSEAVDFCTTAKCKEAAAAEAEAAAKASAASGAAASAEEEVARLQAENHAIQASINKNLAMAEELAGEIKKNEDKLEKQQSALASLLVEMHFNTQDNTLMILAGSETISDLAERQTRKETVQNQVAIAAGEIKKLKESLEAQKGQVDAIIAQQKSQQSQIAANQARQASLLIKYRNNAKAYAADAEKARLIKEQEIAEEIARLNSGGVVTVFGVNTYPYRNNCPADNLKYGTGSQYGGSWGYVCQCVSYTGWKAYERWGVRISGWGNAKNWDNAARAAGYRVDKTPAAGTIAVSEAGTYGHVMWVESVNANGTVNISEYNNSYSSASHKAGDYGNRKNVSTANLQFIHFN